ncbi:MAG: D-alanyl-D-alanine carboxypeptidase/D-alanyl-D-alanine-endopeptidase [Paludibacter sp.]|nr:D-alanyl-D-alanine carboxypeptidase/D-alanyl-D-alanine-endopeptidase [Bacteroidales bacterium]MCM1068607.1 D-alanyl-D-alanine carboxypeptidase/D-alanyl-D-alanine-endopeptidase [Prevotella sp.]MCM1353271.1 D-alanyl-D-alanine carboxypeptidase/D-alanyl-D-alanine-endopeptidase [Bacteroides sp.]MCM1442321.1 D-alanyl-D-alanine carboxypeptidase/D-alanyl-D-alanine-endopeptidase [Muribaculum sp.]MCM1481140.1 D-alanyl-D-alanine carboxypeptidase/D-alanyl-D-alanine-endopeptidase [Paludibacter sp.]
MKKFILLLIGFQISLSIYGQEDILLPLLSNENLKNANISVCVRNTTTGKTIATYRSQNTVPPASTMKVLTTATALELLGEDFRFPTYIETDGNIVNGVLKGNLYVRGTGDPTLGSKQAGNPAFLYTWVNAIKGNGIRSIEGNIIADVTFFDGDAINPQWIWEDIGNYYAPGIFALPYLDNTLHIQLRSSAIGSVAEVVKTTPQIEGLIFENHIRCTSIAYDGAYVHGVPYSNIRYLTGSVPSNRGIFGVRGDIPNPPLLLAQHLMQRLQASGVSVSGEATYMTEGLENIGSRKLIYMHESAPLHEIVAETNLHSNNLYAEQLFRYLGSKISLPCTIPNSIETERNCWRNRGINLQSTFIMDGCGLAPQDGTSAETLVEILCYMLKSPHSEAFIASLPKAGETGTLKGFLAGTALQGKVQAKSGTTSRIKSYAGYMELPNGDSAVFAIIVNNANCKAKAVQRIIENFLLHVYQSNQ